MPSKQILAVAAFAASASANFMPIARRDFVEARAADSGDDACSTALGQILPIYTEIPYPPKELLTVTIPTDPCETPDITGSLAAEYTSYTSKVLGWYSLHSAELLSALTGCSELAGYATEVPVCSTAAVASAYPTATESAPEETGYVSSGSGSGSGDSGSDSDSSDSGSSSGGDSYDASGSGSGDESSAGSGSGDESSSGSDESSSGSSSGSGSEESSSGSDSGSSGSGSEESGSGAEESSSYGAGAGAGAGGAEATATASEGAGAGAGGAPSVTGFDYSSSTATKGAQATYVTAAAARETGLAAGIIAAAGLGIAVLVL